MPGESTEYQGLSLQTSSEVYEPAEDTFLAAEHLLLILKSYKGESLSVLEMGCGAGLLGMIAAKSEKVSGVVFCDKNENAIELAMKNCELNEDELNAKRSFMHTDLFSKIPESEVFDLMIFNTPYLPREDSAKLHSDETAWDGGEKGIEIAERFLKEAVPRLSEGGRILLVSSSFADLSRLLEKASAMGYEKIEEKKKHIFFEDLVSILLQKRQNPL